MGEKGGLETGKGNCRKGRDRGEKGKWAREMG